MSHSPQRLDGCLSSRLHRMFSHMANWHQIGLSWKRGACVWFIQWLLIVTGTYCLAALLLCVCVCACVCECVSECEHMCVSVAATLMQLPEIESRTKLWAEMSAKWAMLSSGQSFPDIYLLLKKTNHSIWHWGSTSFTRGKVKDFNMF